MFTKLATFATLAAAAFASPVDLQGRSSHHKTIIKAPVFNDWHGIKSLHGFDNFWGSHNFIGVSPHQVVLRPKHELVCRKVQVEIIQQRLVVLQELAKKIITEQICEVETQTVVFQQFHTGLGFFRHDLDRSSKRHVGYDAHIAGLYHGLFDRDGSLSTWDLGFRGHDVGRHVIVPSGHNWDAIRSPPIIKDLYDATGKAVGIADEGIPDVESADVEPDVEVDNAADVAPAADDEAAADDAGDDAAAADVAAADAGEDAKASGSANAAVVVETNTASASSSASSSAAAATGTANVDPATAP